MSQSQKVEHLLTVLKATPEILLYARNIATAVVNGPKNHCAATLSALLVFVDIYPNGAGTGKGDLEPWVPSLAFDLEKRRGWKSIAVMDTIHDGDVGVVIVDENTHHIYLVIDSTDQSQPLVADNQGLGFHQRAVGGDPAKGYSPTTYFLRA